MFRPSRSSSGRPRKQIQELFSFSALWNPKCSQVSVKEANLKLKIAELRSKIAEKGKCKNIKKRI